jgi:hypothetical protein
MYYHMYRLDPRDVFKVECYNWYMYSYIRVTERYNTETKEAEIFVADRKLTGYTSYTHDTGNDQLSP